MHARLLPNFARTAVQGPDAIIEIAHNKRYRVLLIIPDEDWRRQSDLAGIAIRSVRVCRLAILNSIRTRWRRFFPRLSRGKSRKRQ
jgi:hypothetical protein